MAFSFYRGWLWNSAGVGAGLLLDSTQLFSRQFTSHTQISFDYLMSSMYLFIWINSTLSFPRQWSLFVEKKCNCSVLIWWPHIFLAIVYFDKLDECRANHLILLPASVRRSTAILLSESGWSILVERRKPWWRLYNDTEERARQAAWHVLSLDLCIRFKYWIVGISA